MLVLAAAPMLAVAVTLAFVALASSPIVALAAGRSDDAPGAQGSASREGSPRTSIEAARRAKQNYFRDHPFSPLRAFARHDFLPFEPGREPTAIVGAGEGAEVRLDAPGIPPDLIRITVLNPQSAGGPYRFRLERRAPGGDIRLDGTALAEEGPEATTVVPEETKIEIGPFERHLQLPEEVDVERATARLEHGLLTIVLPIAERPLAPVKVPIEVDVP